MTASPSPQERKSAQITQFRKFIHVNSHAVYRSSHSDPSGIDYLLEHNVGDGELGSRARKALHASRFLAPNHHDFDRVIRVPSDDDIKARNERLLEIAGLKTTQSLYKGAKLVLLRLQDGALMIRPSRHRGSGVFEGIREADPVILPETVSDINLGMVIREAIDRSL